MHHVAVGDQIFLAFEPKLSSLARAGFASFPGMLVGILFARIVAEFILMVFRINEHLAAIRNRGGCERAARRKSAFDPQRPSVARAINCAHESLRGAHRTNV